MREARGAHAFVARNLHLVRRYWGWEIAFFVFTVPFVPYAPDPNRLAPGPSAPRLWQEIRADKVLDKNFTSGAAKASQAKPGQKSKNTSPAKKAQAAVNGLCA